MEETGKKSASVMPYDKALVSASPRYDISDGEDHREENEVELKIRVPRSHQPEVVSPLSAFAAKLHQEKDAAGAGSGHLDSVEHASGRVSPEREREDEEGSEEGDGEFEDEDGADDQPLIRQAEEARSAEPGKPVYGGLACHTRPQSPLCGALSPILGDGYSWCPYVRS